jgi:hypothetical protein
MRDAIAAGINAFEAAWDTDEPTRLMGEFAERRRRARAAR